MANDELHTSYTPATRPKLLARTSGSALRMTRASGLPSKTDTVMIGLVLGIDGVDLGQAYHPVL